MDKKALKREYKETARPMGVFQIRNTVNGKVWLGTSVDLPSILNRHRAQLRAGSHRNKALQQDWNAFGMEAFALEILDTLAPSDRPTYDPARDLVSAARCQTEAGRGQIRRDRLDAAGIPAGSNAE